MMREFQERTVMKQLIAFQPILTESSGRVFHSPTVKDMS